jgi:hypothetical protein
MGFGVPRRQLGAVGRHMVFTARSLDETLP